MKMPSRMDQGLFARWWWSVDQVNLAIISVIIGIGMTLIMAAGPVAAARLSHVSDFHFPLRQMIFLGPAVGTMLLVSFMSPLQVRRAGVIIFAISLLLMVLVMLIGDEINGAKRWLDLGPLLLQPSEFAKIGFVIAAAWMLAEGARDPRLPGGFIALGLYCALSAMLVTQPDFGQWVLVTMVWAVMFFIAGWSWLWIIGLGVLAVGAIVVGYMFVPHVTRRIDVFLNPASGDSYQVDKAIEAIANGGDWGLDVGAASAKHHLPDAHTDFIFAVGGEAFGFLFCLLIILLFAMFVVRAFMKAFNQTSIFVQCAVCGLASLIGFQAMINIGVNMRVLPAKGMTLPFISYGGSSLFASALAVGFLFALTKSQTPIRRRKEIMP